jgi:probable HAF family extracellular repeat protein
MEHRLESKEISMNAPIVMLGRLAIAATTLAAAAALAGDEPSSHRRRPTEYRIVTLSDLGANASGRGINDEKLITGFATLADGSGRHAMMWLHGFRFDLGTLGGPNSNVPWPVKNKIGLIAGIAQTDIPEPLNQNFSCRGFFEASTSGNLICRGVVWEEGRIRALPTLGGFNSFATGANNHRQVVGWAQNTVLDPTCNPLFVKQQFVAVMWGPGENQIQELRPLPGTKDSTSAATAINDKGQVVGISGDCGTAVGASSAREAVMWHKGKIQVIGNLGGIAWNTPMAINERGDVVGFSNTSPASSVNPEWTAFYWSKGTGIKNLGALDGFPRSQGLGINERRTIVGTSCTADFGDCLAVVWENGRRFDMNDLAPGFPDQLFAANDINDDGHIAGRARVRGTNRIYAIWAIPLRRHDHDHDRQDSESPY